ncbi:MAG: beta-ketoacyl-ACP synthase III [Candidatus Pelethousia sp.]|nr:beta-ketoacyl-ACP synthase III [Candidatus Pelethousia sp.]
MGLEVMGTGRCLPSRCISNEEMSRMVDTSDAWITSRTGIRQRYFCAQGETNALLATTAARKAMENAGVGPADIGLCIVATFTPDRATPSVACEVQETLSLAQTVPCFDVNAACTGFLMAMETARCFLLGGNASAPCALVIGSEKLSRVIDFSDRSTCVLFGDGAGAAVVRLAPDRPYAADFGARGDASILYAGGDAPFLHMDGQGVFRFAVDIIPRCMDAVLHKAGLTLADIHHVVCHQANSRIIGHVVKKLGENPEKFYENMQRYGNTSAASIPIALDEMLEQGRILPGQNVLCVGFGAGLTWGGTLLRF